MQKYTFLPIVDEKIAVACQDLKFSLDPADTMLYGDAATGFTFTVTDEHDLPIPATLPSHN